jgi:hypothetical protein
MTAMPKSRRFMQLLLRPVVLALSLAQLAVAVAPAIDRVEKRDAGIHLESEGTSLHYVHDDTACPACQAQHLIGRVVTPDRLVFFDVLAPRLAPTSSVATPLAASHHTTAPRAPPADRIG